MQIEGLSSCIRIEAARERETERDHHERSAFRDNPSSRVSRFGFYGM